MKITVNNKNNNNLDKNKISSTNFPTSLSNFSQFSYLNSLNTLNHTKSGYKTPEVYSQHHNLCDQKE